MKFGELKSIGHNIADSFASGLGLLIGLYETDVFGEASASREGFIEVDFLSGKSSGAKPSKKLDRAIKLYSERLSSFCEAHGARRDMFASLLVRYATDRVHGRFFRVSITNRSGRSAVDTFVGVPGRRLRTQ